MCFLSMASELWTVFLIRPNHNFEKPTVSLHSSYEIHANHLCSIAYAI